jgi:hypothetical protein
MKGRAKIFYSHLNCFFNIEITMLHLGLSRSLAIIYHAIDQEGRNKPPQSTYSRYVL